MEAAHRSQPAPELTMIGLDRIVGAVLGKVPRRQHEFSSKVG
jgi:hypothetical protein